MYDSCSCNENEITHLIQKGRIFLSEKDSIARNNQIINLMLPYNDNMIFDVETGRLLIDADNESVLNQYDIKSSQ